jgi:all-trans-retinol dehydrogenase (NAD+)
MTRLHERIVLVTGGASGIGRLLVTHMAQRGSQVVVWDVNEEAMRELVSESKGGGERVHAYVCDVSDREAVYETGRRVEADLGPIDVLVNNAGVVHGKTLLQLADEDIERTFRTNVMAVFWTIREFLPGMVKRNCGHVVNMASAAGMVGVRQLTDYCASKSAVVGLHEALRMELKKSAPGVRTTLVCPFYVNTGMFYGVRTRFSWLLPILEPERAAETIVRGIEKDRPQIVMPWFVRCLPILRALPQGVFDRLMDLVGVNDSMTFFVGRSRILRRRGGDRHSRKRVQRNGASRRWFWSFPVSSRGGGHGDNS